jgi:hypothetical protein
MPSAMDTRLVVSRGAVGALVAGQVAVLMSGGYAAAFVVQPDKWSVSIAETREASAADEAAASMCGRLPGANEIAILASLPGSIVVSGEGRTAPCKSRGRMS